MRRTTAVLLGAPLAFVIVCAVEAVVAITRTSPNLLGPGGPSRLPPGRSPGPPIGGPGLPDPDEVVEITVGTGGAGDPLRLAVLGDSTVRGVGSATLETVLPRLVADRVGAELGRPVVVTGLGVSGATTNDLTRDQVPLLDALDLDAVVVVIGSNDVTHVTPPWAMRARTAAMLEAVRAEVGDAAIVLGGIPQFHDTPALAEPLNWVVGTFASVQRNAQRRGAADASVPFVDIAALAGPRFAETPASMSPDGFHPSEIGYGFWADALAPAVAEAIRSRP